MATLYVTIGLPGCGKSTWASKQNMAVVSSDTIRKILYGDESIQTDPRKVFSIARAKIESYLTSGKDVIMDATNIDEKRDTFIALAQKTNSKVVAVYFDVPTSECIARQSKRDRKVPLRL